jgi:hypothetical protein
MPEMSELASVLHGLVQLTTVGQRLWGVIKRTQATHRPLKSARMTTTVKTKYAFSPSGHTLSPAQLVLGMQSETNLTPIAPFLKGIRENVPAAVLNRPRRRPDWPKGTRKLEFLLRFLDEFNGRFLVERRHAGWMRVC